MNISLNPNYTMLQSTQIKPSTSTGVDKPEVRGTDKPRAAENPLRSIANKYDMANISLSERKSLGKELLDAGVINSFEHAVLTVADLPIDGSDIDENQQTNLVERFEFNSKFAGGKNTVEGKKYFDHLLSLVNSLAALKGTTEIDMYA